MRAIAQYLGKKPLLGICLGQQAIAQVCGWDISHAHVPMHGKPSLINHQSTGLFESLPQPLQVGRYHSLVVLNLNDGENSIENRLELDGNHSVIPLSVDAQCDGEVMALSNPAYGVWAVQFHPESVLTPEGQQIINRWLELAKQYQVAL